ncbi:type IV pilus assembly protein PilM [Caldicoprobacter guelmensis]|uniref:type IV pilus biogenesis protein PilM n=1 Tax=Caldicoprobacter guelmensis TaxID=1170224 RepID=UPI00195E808F|nr:pilus assembly protein PilM [Caldicoprobacter guelmensis]MBM7581272.1 type IV pilus assembly protein PilM [Caldicoprobacter guelmensis]
MKKIANSLMGIDIGSGFIKMLQLSYEDGIKISRWGLIETPKIGQEMVTVDEGEVARAIRECYRHNGFTTKRVAVCLSDLSIIFRDIRLPEMKDEEIRENVKFEMAEYFSIDPDKYSITYRILGREEDEGRTVLRVLGVAAPLELIAKHLRIIKKAGLRPEYVDINVNAYLKAAKLLSEIEDISKSRGVCIMDYGYSTLTICVFENGTPFVIRTVDKSWEDDNFDAVAAILTQVMDYYYSRSYTWRIEKVWVVGGGSLATDLCQYLELQTGTEVKKVTPSILRIEHDDDQAFPVGIYFKCLGAAIRED